MTGGAPEVRIDVHTGINRKKKKKDIKDRLRSDLGQFVYWDGRHLASITYTRTTSFVFCEGQ